MIPKESCPNSNFKSQLLEWEATCISQTKIAYDGLHPALQWIKCRVCRTPLLSQCWVINDELHKECSVLHLTGIGKVDYNEWHYY